MYIIKLKGIPSYEIHADQLWKYLNLWYDVVGFKPDYKKKCQYSRRKSYGDGKDYL